MRGSVFAISAVAMVAAGAALADTKSFDFDDFTRIDVSAGLDVVVRQGDAFTIEADGSHKALKRLDIKLHGDTLNISQSNKGLARFSPILNMMEHSASVTVTLPSLESVNATSGSDVQVSGAYDTEFSGAASSGADLELTGIDAKAVALEVSSGADIQASGTCGHLVASASSGSDLDAKGLICDSATAEASSGADMDLSAGEVEAKASSGANVDVYGAKSVTAEESSGGNVDHHD